MGFSVGLTHRRPAQMAVLQSRGVSLARKFFEPSSVGDDSFFWTDRSMADSWANGEELSNGSQRGKRSKRLNTHSLAAHVQRNGGLGAFPEKGQQADFQGLTPMVLAQICPFTVEVNSYKSWTRFLITPPASSAASEYLLSPDTAAALFLCSVRRASPCGRRVRYPRCQRGRLRG